MQEQKLNEIIFYLKKIEKLQKIYGITNEDIYKAKWELENDINKRQRD